jgi:Na+-transporting methylmalonyl-CoA/oxaloacetate decarboxylase gamma subunit
MAEKKPAKPKAEPKPKAAAKPKASPKMKAAVAVAIHDNSKKANEVELDDFGNPVHSPF